MTPQNSLFAIVLVCCSFPGSAFAQSELNWSVTPYLWASDTTVDLTFRDNNLGSGDITFKELLDALDVAFMVQVEAGRGQWSAFTDIAYLATSDTTQRNLVTIDADNKQTFVDVAAAYWPSGIDGALSVYGGVRYTGFDDRYRIFLGDTELPMRRSSSDYYDALFGIRYRFTLGERWALATRGDVSFGDSEGTVLLRANFAYSVGQRRQNVILFGYQYKRADYTNGELRTDFEYMGPTAGFSFRF